MIRNFANFLVSEENINSMRMESMRSGWRTCVSLLLVLSAAAVVGGARPEVVLANVLTKPFVPREFASLECIRDGEIYLKALETYTPWALQSK